MRFRRHPHRTAGVLASRRLWAPSQGYRPRKGAQWHRPRDRRQCSAIDCCKATSAPPAPKHTHTIEWDPVFHDSKGSRLCLEISGPGCPRSPAHAVFRSPHVSKHRPRVATERAWRHRLPCRRGRRRILGLTHWNRGAPRRDCASRASLCSCHQAESCKFRPCEQEHETHDSHRSRGCSLVVCSAVPCHRHGCGKSLTRCPSPLKSGRLACSYRALALCLHVDRVTLPERSRGTAILHVRATGDRKPYTPTPHHIPTGARRD